MTTLTKSAFKSRALEHFRQVEATGEPIIITDHGSPKLEIRPYRSTPTDPLETLRGAVLRYDDPTAPIAADDWEAAS